MKCKLCETKDKCYRNMSLLKEDNGYHIRIWSMDYAASLYSDEDVYTCSTTEFPVKFCPLCAKELNDA